MPRIPRREQLPRSLLKKAERASLMIPPPLPLFSGAPNKIRLQAWVDSQITPLVRKAAQILVDAIEHIDFTTFLQQLKVVVDDFHSQLGDKKYLLVIPEFQGYKLNKGCSEPWVASVALTYCGLKEPLAIIYPDEVVNALEKYPRASLLILDDLICSGAQKRGQIGYLCQLITGLYMYRVEQGDLELRKNRLFIGVPFAAEHGIESLKDIVNNPFPTTILNYKKMKSLKDHLSAGLSAEEFHALASIQGFRLEDMSFSSKVLTCFDHADLDFLSTFLPFTQDGRPQWFRQFSELMSYAGYDARQMPQQEYEKQFLRLVAPDYNNPHPGGLFPVIIKPYTLFAPSKEKRAQARLKLRESLKHGYLGARLPFNSLDDEELRKILCDTPSSDPIYAPFLVPELPLAIQVSFDNEVLKAVNSLYPDSWKRLKFQPRVLPRFFVASEPARSDDSDVETPVVGKSKDGESFKH